MQNVFLKCLCLHAIVVFVLNTNIPITNFKCAHYVLYLSIYVYEIANWKQKTIENDKPVGIILYNIQMWILNMKK